jgi:hypothetical protein
MDNYSVKDEKTRKPFGKRILSGVVGGLANCTATS